MTVCRRVARIAHAIPCPCVGDYDFTPAAEKTGAHHAEALISQPGVEGGGCQVSCALIADADVLVKAPPSLRSPHTSALVTAKLTPHTFEMELGAGSTNERANNSFKFECM